MLWIPDLTCRNVVEGITAHLPCSVLELSRVLTLLEPAICDWTLGLVPALTAVMKLGAVANWKANSHVCSKSACNKWGQAMTLQCLHCVSSWFYLCVKYTFSQKLIWSSEVWCQNTYAYLLGPQIQVLVLAGEEHSNSVYGGFTVTLSIQSVDFACSFPHS